jgi:hypothetical protein
VNVGQALHLLAQSPTAATLDSVLMLRVSHVFPDVNAAGSYFVMALFVTGGLAVSVRRFRLVWLLATLFAVVGFWLSGSRAAFAAAPVAGLCLAGFLATHRRLPRTKLLVPSLLGLVILASAGYLVARQTPGRDARLAMQWRMEMGATAIRMFRAHPIFGVGAGRFYVRSSDYSSPEWRQYQNENAHNNFLQVLAELGIAGFALLVALLTTALIASYRHGALSRSEAWAGGAATGVLAFLATWVAGHPLLVREVAVSFWLVLALVSGYRPLNAPPMDAQPRPSRLWPLLFGISGLVMLGLTPLVAERHLARADLTREGRGFSQWHKADDVRFRWMFRRAVLYVPGDAGVVAVGLRSPGAAATVRILVENRLAEQLVVEGDAWREARIEVPRGYPWKSVPVEISVRSRQRPAGAAAPEADMEHRIQVALPRVVQ